MRVSTDRILTTHVGSLPRPASLLSMLVANQKGAAPDPAFAGEADRAVLNCVRDQVAAGVDIVSDGEMSKFTYTFYAKDRLKGIAVGTGPGGDASRMVSRDLLDHPDFRERLLAGLAAAFAGVPFPVCVDAVSYGNTEPLKQDLARLKAAVKEAKPVDAFVTAASPGVLARFIANKFYSSEDQYLAALAEAMRHEYNEIVASGFVLQLDCPDLASSRTTVHKDLSDAEFLKIVERNVAVLNHATRDIAPESMRLHICWGNYAGPHTYDIPFATIFDACMKARPAAVSFEAANPRHAHEWEDLARLKIPDDKILIPGVIDSTTNFVEHPNLVAQRLRRFADIVGRERVIAGVDCGMGTIASYETVAPSIVWSKLKSLAQGAELASAKR